MTPLMNNTSTDYKHKTKRVYEELLITGCGTTQAKTTQASFWQSNQ